MTAIETPSSPAPDWSTAVAAGGDVLCPMCEYNLHGLTEARCPECGFTFDWPDLIDPTRRKHKYLFEHYPHRNVWSFARTAAGGLLPWRFWRSLRPEQPSNLRRLFAYWLITACGFLVLPAAIYAMSCITTNKSNITMRGIMAARANDPVFAKSIVEAHGSLQAFLDLFAPVAPSRPFFAYVWRGLHDRYSFDVVIALILCVIALPWVVALSLMLFQATMRRARVRGAHVLRCCLYSFDNGWWFGLLLIGLFGLGFLEMVRMPAVPGLVTALPHLVLVAAGVMLLAGCAKLLFAYWLYMRFPHAIPTVILALLLAFLLLATILVNLPGMEAPLIEAWRSL